MFNSSLLLLPIGLPSLTHPVTPNIPDIVEPSDIRFYITEFLEQSLLTPLGILTRDRDSQPLSVIARVFIGACPRNNNPCKTCWTWYTFVQDIHKTGSKKLAPRQAPPPTFTYTKIRRRHRACVSEELQVIAMSTKIQVNQFLEVLRDGWAKRKCRSL